MTPILFPSPCPSTGWPGWAVAIGPRVLARAVDPDPVWAARLGRDLLAATRARLAAGG